MRRASSRELEIIKTRIFQLPFLDRVTALIASVVENERDAAVDGLIKLTARMAEQYSPDSRLRIAEFMRTTADDIDHSIDEARWMTTTTAGE